MKNKNPINQDEKEKQAQQPERILPQIESDSFSEEEQKQIVKMVMDAAEVGYLARQEWKDKKRTDVLHLNNAKPTEIEGLTKKTWMSDRNLGLASGVSDIYQATLLATCFNPDLIHFRATAENDVNNRDNLEKFTKWILSDSETKAFPEMDDFINNRVNLGFSLLKVGWEVKYEWVDKRIPRFDPKSKKRVIGYDIETENRRIEKGFLRNVDELDDILIPSYGKTVQDLGFFIEILHITPDTFQDLADRGVILNFKESKFTGVQPTDTDKLSERDQQELGRRNVKSSGSETEKLINYNDVYEAYLPYTKNGKHEKYRFWVHPQSWTFMAGVPLRKVTRSGRLPYFGGPLRRRPGFLRGGSLISLISPLINALNNNYNQTSDFQYMENCPHGYYDTGAFEGQGQQIQEIEPGKMTGVSGDPSKQFLFPNLTRSLAWSYQDKQFLLEMIERLTGAASYFLTSSTQSSTATRDNIVEQKGEVKFGLWVKRIQSDMCEAINELIMMYQDWAPPDLAKRVVGEDGKYIIKNLSINSIRGNYGPYMTPDITSGSKAYERQVAMWAFQALQQGSVWLSPQVNPRGNWLLTKYIMEKQGIDKPEHYLPPQPKEQGDYNKESEEHFNMMLNGDSPEPPGPDNPQIVECLATMLRLKESRYQELDEEYKPIFEQYMFKAFFNYSKFMKNVAQEQAQMRLATGLAGHLESLGMRPPAPAGAQPALNVPPVAPGGNNAAVTPKIQSNVYPNGE